MLSPASATPYVSVLQLLLQLIAWLWGHHLEIVCIWFIFLLHTFFFFFLNGPALPWHGSCPLQLHGGLGAFRHFRIKSSKWTYLQRLLTCWSSVLPLFSHSSQRKAYIEYLHAVGNVSISPEHIPSLKVSASDNANERRDEFRVCVSVVIDGKPKWVLEKHS